jgi:hypothetical protein
MAVCYVALPVREVRMSKKAIIALFACNVVMLFSLVGYIIYMQMQYDQRIADLNLQILKIGKYSVDSRNSSEARDDNLGNRISNLEGSTATGSSDSQKLYDAIRRTSGEVSSLQSRLYDVEAAAYAACRYLSGANGVNCGRR